MRSTFLIFLLMCFCNQIFANNCKDILVNGIFNEYSAFQGKSSYHALKHFLCRDSGAISDSGANLVGKVLNEISGNLGLRNKESWYNKECRKLEEQSSSSSVEHIYIKSASSEVLNAWQSCMAQKNNGLVCYIKEYSKKSFGLVVQYSHLLNTVENVRFILNNFTSLEDLSLETEIYPGQQEEFFLTRDDESLEAMVKIKGKTQDYRVSCSKVVPAYIVIEPGIINDPKPSYCAKLFDHEFYAGTRHKMGPGEEVEDFYTLGLNDLFTSVRIHPGCQLEMYEAHRYLGRKIVVDEHISSFRGKGWSDNISSAKCKCEHLQ